MPPLFDLSGRVAIVTGSSRGIGRAIALRMAEHGARVVVSSRGREACEPVAAEIRASGGEALVHPCHVGRKEELRSLVDATIAHWGRLDALVVNAAANPYFGPAIDCPDDAFERVMATNVTSAFRLCNMALPHLAAHAGSVVVVSSIAGLRGTPVIGPYGISKAADMQLVRNIAVEWGHRGVRANCIAPGLVRTDFARALWEDPDTLARRTRDTPLARIGEPDEIAGAAVFLCSPASAFMTGQTIVIDGGVTIGSAVAE